MKTEKKHLPLKSHSCHLADHLDNLNLNHLVGDAKTGHMDRPCHHLGMIPLKLTRGYGYVLYCLFCVFAKAFCDLNDSKGSKN